MLNDFSIENLETDVQSLVSKIKNEETSKEERLQALQDLNSLLESGLEYVKNTKNNII
jgi:hypothetical protein